MFDEAYNLTKGLKRLQSSAQIQLEFPLDKKTSFYVVLK